MTIAFSVGAKPGTSNEELHVLVQQLANRAGRTLYLVAQIDGVVDIPSERIHFESLPVLAASDRRRKVLGSLV